MRFVSPDRSILYSPVSGDVQPTYQEAWLTDGRPGYPVRSEDGSPLTLGPLTVTPAAAVSCDVFAVTHHTIEQGATISLGGSITDAIPTAAWRKDGIPANWYLRRAAASIASLTLTVTGNAAAVYVGELYAGLSYQFATDFLINREYDPGEPFAWEGEFSSLLPHDSGVAQPRRYRGSMILEDADYAELVAWGESQRNGSRPSLIVLNDAVNDALLGYMKFRETFDTVYHYISLEIVEIPLLRWP